MFRRHLYSFGLAVVVQRNLTSRSNTSHVSCECVPPFSSSSEADVIIIGGGVVGLAVAHEFASKYKQRVVLLEKEDSVAAGASSGNSGLGCTGYDAPVGSLERRLLRRSIRIHQNLYRSFGLSYEHVKKCGSLVVAWDPVQLEKLHKVLQDNLEAGDADVRLLSQSELLELEPALSPLALGAVLLPREAVVEPWLVPMAYAHHAIRHGASIIKGQEVKGARFDRIVKKWEVYTKKSDDRSLGRSMNNELLSTAMNSSTNDAVDCHALSSSSLPLSSRDENDDGLTTHRGTVVINCAGLFGDDIESLRISGEENVTRGNEHDDSFHITPRKGQFVVFAPLHHQHSSTDEPILLNHIIEPVATEFTKGVIVWETVYGNIIVGPTAVDVTSKTDRSTDLETIESLRRYGEKVVPALRNAAVVGTYSGLRPATQYRDYQIKSYPSQNWITVGGIRSTGLSASSGIAEYVGELWAAQQQQSKCPNSDGNLPAVPVFGCSSNSHESSSSQSNAALPLSPDGLEAISACAHNPEQRALLVAPPSSNTHETVSSSSSSRISSIAMIPSLKELAESYRHHDAIGNKGYVTLFGEDCRVTHPISSFGMESYRK